MAKCLAECLASRQCACGLHDQIVHLKPTRKKIKHGRQSRDINMLQPSDLLLEMTELQLWPPAEVSRKAMRLLPRQISLNAIMTNS